MNLIKSLSQKGNVCCFTYLYVSMFVCTYACIQVDPFFILEVTGTTKYQLVSEG